MNVRLVVVAAVLFASQVAHTQTDKLGMNVYLPTFEARFSIGFNYDLLKSLTDVSFDNSKGFFGFNVPLEQTLNLRSMTGYMDPAVDEMFADTTLVKNGDDFKPKAGARQNPNITVRVDVPMMGGVASFSTVQNFFMNYQTILGNPNIFLSPNMDSLGIEFLLRGTLNVPLNLSMNWETMTFAYAFNVNKWMTLALALHRHVFSLDLRGKIDADILGRYKVDLSQSGVSLPPIRGNLDYSSERIHGSVYGYYDATVWSPSIGMKMWRFGLDARFGINTRAHGGITATYALPFFIDPETFASKINFNDAAVFNDPAVRMGLQMNATDSLTYTTQRTVNGKKVQSDLEWRMPTGLSLSFDVIKDHFSLSYSKLFGSIGLKLDRISKITTSIDSLGNSGNDSIVIDLGVSIDHIILMHIAAYKAYLNLGIFAMDFSAAGRDHILGDAMIPEMRLGSAAMLPVLNVGSLIGTRWQLMLELDVLPLPALRSGLVYNF